MKKLLYISVVCLLNVSTITPRYTKYIATAATMATQFIFTYKAYSDGKYGLLKPLDTDHKQKLQKTCSNKLEQAVIDNSRYQWKRLEHWKREEYRKQCSQIPEEQKDNAYRYLWQCIQRTCAGPVITGAAMLAPTGLLCTCAVKTAKNIPLVPLLLARSSLITAINGWFACSDTSKICNTLRPYKDRIYHHCDTMLHNNTPLFNGIVHSYCRNNQNNKSIKKWMQQPNNNAVPVTFGRYTAYFNHELFDKGIAAIHGDKPIPQNIIEHIRKIETEPSHIATHDVNETCNDNITLLSG